MTSAAAFSGAGVTLGSYFFGQLGSWSIWYEPSIANTFLFVGIPGIFFQQVCQYLFKLLFLFLSSFVLEFNPVGETQAA